ncbi:DUF4403 family protein [Erythrobacter sp.]|nr:DUF4403 family protein [Erythrobacter sp.]
MSYKRFAQCMMVLSLAACSDGGLEPADDVAETTETDAGPDLAAADTTPDLAGSDKVASDVAATKNVAATEVSNELTCASPVSASGTARSLLSRFGKDALLATLSGGEGTEIPGLVLWPDNPKRRIEVAFESEAREKLLSFRIVEGSEWEVAGIGRGDTLEHVVATNEAPIDFYGFEWDYTGTVAKYRGGKLEQLDGGCRPLMSLTYDVEYDDLPGGLIGDRLIPSTSADIPKDGLKVSELGLSFVE